VTHITVYLAGPSLGFPEKKFFLGGKTMQPANTNTTGLNCTVAIVAAKPLPETDGFIAIAALSLNGLTFALIVARGLGSDALQLAARAIAGSAGPAANSSLP
jgi:hypothetical protein